ncbi:hypothetical protein BV25DRAFT_1920637 [Artomyces pyxidatus]|uniref:Uncharacterized protein n=1 Tax=Artomyces pyxidatus TaxID=48021 RepID=A0ACB8SKV6_9AGAM|nr:hypothetical protein BV25DRAFT_1920637 [Artomyces pyxidatus]
MLSLTPTTFLFFLGVILEASAQSNDWNVPCFEGFCTYDLPRSAGVGGGQLQVWGSSNAISDITDASGWSILNCDPDGHEQDIQLECANDHDGCDHLFNNGGMDTIVRLPENCGQMPFARVGRIWIHGNYSLPPEASLVNRIPGLVHALTLDTNFGAINPDKNGNVSFTIISSSAPGDFSNVSPTSKRDGDLVSRDFVSDGLAKMSAIGKFNKTLSHTIPINVDKFANILSLSTHCQPNSLDPYGFDASISIDVATTVNATLQLGVVAAGSLIPPAITEIGLFAGLDGNIDSKVHITASASGLFDTTPRAVFQVGIPSVDVPGILTLGPEFVVNTRINAELELDIDAKVDLSYHANDAQIFFPPEKGNSCGEFPQGDSQLDISASPTLAADALVEGHIIPQIGIQVTALGGIASAMVFLQLDAYAEVKLTSNATQPQGIPGQDSSGYIPPPPSEWATEGCLDISTTLDVGAGVKGSFFNLLNEQQVISLWSRTYDLFTKCFTGHAGSGAARTPSSRRSNSLDLYKSKLNRRADIACHFFLPTAEALVETMIPGI